MWYTTAFNQEPPLNNSDDLLNLVNALKGVPQDPKYHPEGDVYVHTMEVVNNASEIATRENLDPKDRQVLMLAAMLHDVGKAAATQMQLQDASTVHYRDYDELQHGPAQIIAHGHDEAGINDIDTVLSRMNVDPTTRQQVKTLVSVHMYPGEIINSSSNVSNSSFRRLIKRLSEVGLNPSMLRYLHEADVRRQWREFPPENAQLFERIQEVANQSVREQKPNVISGNIIIDMIQQVFRNKPYPPQLIGELVRSANELGASGASKEDIISNLENIILEKYYIL
jgi:putative nucleotidyltransferase with HDIG domain